MLLEESYMYQSMNFKWSALCVQTSILLGSWFRHEAAWNWVWKTEVVSITWINYICFGIFLFKGPRDMPEFLSNIYEDIWLFL